MFMDKNRATDNVQKHNIFSNVPSSQNFRSQLNVHVINTSRAVGIGENWHRIGFNGMQEIMIDVIEFRVP
jgi:hypothetical protein